MNNQTEETKAVGEMATLTDRKEVQGEPWGGRGVLQHRQAYSCRTGGTGRRKVRSPQGGVGRPRGKVGG